MVNFGRWVGVTMLSMIVSVPVFFMLSIIYIVLFPFSPVPSKYDILGGYALTIAGLTAAFGFAFHDWPAKAEKIMGEMPGRIMTHPFLKGLGTTLLLSFGYAFTLLTSSMGPSVWSLLEYSFLPVVVVVNIGGAALYMRSEYHNMNGLGRYAAGVGTIVGLDAVLFFMFLLLLFTGCATSAC